MGTQCALGAQTMTSCWMQLKAKNSLLTSDMRRTPNHPDKYMETTSPSLTPLNSSEHALAINWNGRQILSVSWQKLNSEFTSLGSLQGTGSSINFSSCSTQPSLHVLLSSCIFVSRFWGMGGREGGNGKLKKQWTRRCCTDSLLGAN